MLQPAVFAFVSVLGQVMMVLPPGLMSGFSIPKVYLDPLAPQNLCGSQLLLTNGLYSSGFILSHYPSSPSRHTVNCTITLMSTPGKNILLRFMEFTLRGISGLCSHSNKLRIYQGSGVPVNKSDLWCDDRSWKARSVLTNHNSLTLWWQTTGNGYESEFKLLWTVFTTLKSNACENDEFRCDNSRCIHMALVCDEIAHCEDDSDITERYRVISKCKDLVHEKGTHFRIGLPLLMTIIMVSVAVVLFAAGTVVWYICSRRK